jgi:hypothetical protein
MAGPHAWLSSRRGSKNWMAARDAIRLLRPKGARILSALPDIISRALIIVNSETLPIPRVYDDSKTRIS